jgi:hypothetical protein
MNVDRFPTMDPDEVRDVTFDFAAQVSTTDTAFVAATVTATVIVGTDPNPSAVLVGLPDYATFPSVVQRVTGGLTGVTYKIRCLAVTDGGQEILIAGLLPVRQA